MPASENVFETNNFFYLYTKKFLFFKKKKKKKPFVRKELMHLTNLIHKEIKHYFISTYLDNILFVFYEAIVIQLKDQFT